MKMGSEEAKNADLVAHAKPPIVGLIGAPILSVCLLFVAYSLYTSSDHLGGPGPVHLPAGEHGLGGLLVGLILGFIFTILPGAVQSVLFLVLGLLFAFAFVIGVWARIKKPIRLVMDNNGIASFGLFRSKHFSWGEISSVKDAKYGLRLERPGHEQGKSESLYIAHVDVSREEILAVIRKYRSDLI
jgi:hypothetical protein